MTETNITLLGLNVYKIQDIIDHSKNNILNDYRLPIVRKRVKTGDNSPGLSVWLSRFLRTENNLEIIDNYIFQEASNFLHYFLIHVPIGANIKIYTMLDNGVSGEQIKRRFKINAFKNWNIDVFIYTDKKEQHARNILTDNYFINIDKGMRVFGRNHMTEQSDIAVDHKCNICDRSMPIANEVS